MCSYYLESGQKSKEHVSEEKTIPYQYCIGMVPKRDAAQKAFEMVYPLTDDISDGEKQDKNMNPFNKIGKNSLSMIRDCRNKQPRETGLGNTNKHNPS